MRTTDRPEPQELGKKIEQPITPKPHIEIVKGVYRDNNGKLYTNPVPKAD